MFIDRAKALLLVGTISAGCASNDDDGPGAAGAAGVAGAAGAGGAGNGGSSAAGSSGQGGGAGGTPSAGASGQGGGGAGNGGTPSTDGSGQNGPDAGDPDAGALDAGGPDADAPDGPDAGGDAGDTPCDDSTDVVVDCDAVEGNECSEQAGFLSFECEMFEYTMKPATMNAARNCMIALDPPELCVEANTYSCMIVALASSCPDSEADDECTAIVSVCDDPPLAFSECTSALSGMTQDGRDQMVTCMANSCELNACIEGLTF